MEIHQLLVGASPGDAITNAAIEFRNVLRRVCRSEVYARFYDPALEGEVLPMKDLARRQPSKPDDDILLFHSSIGEPEVAALLQERRERLVVFHHNISPPDPFEHWDPRLADRLREGRRELAALSRRAMLAIAPSEYNAADLRALGFRNIKVSPLLLEIDRLRGLDAHGPTENHLRENVHGPVVLFVAQLLPHKRTDLLLSAYHALVTYLLPEAHLIVVGTSRLPAYTESLAMLIRELHLPRAWMTGRVSNEALVAFYRRADAFVTVSDHEGFCAPLVEAMAFDVPVMARRAAAIPETVGDAAVLLPEDAGPLLIAEGMAELLTNSGLRSALVARGRERVAHFSPSAARAQLLAHLLELV